MAVIEDDELGQFTRMAAFIARYGDDGDDFEETLSFQACLNRFADELGLDRAELRRKAVAVVEPTAEWDLDTGARQFMTDALALKEAYGGSSRLLRYHTELRTLAAADKNVSEAEQFMLDEVARVWELDPVDTISA